MRGFAEYTIVGRVGKITEAGPTLKISIAAEYGRKDEGGEFRQNTFWNTVTVFREGTIKWLKDNVRPGDIVCAKGTIRETSYDKNGETVYGVTLAAENFDLLAPKADTNDQQG